MRRALFQVEFVSPVALALIAADMCKYALAGGYPDFYEKRSDFIDTVRQALGLTSLSSGEGR